MKLFRRRTWILIPGGTFGVLLIALFIHSFVLSVNAVDNSYTIRILEITDPNSTASLALDANDRYPNSELDNLQGLGNIKIDTMTMKRFVSLRENWDGKYDAVYIGKGAFSKTLINSTGSTSEADRKIAHNTTAVENDITRLKAKEITDYYISKGLNVIFREETFTGQNRSGTEGVLYETFNPYRTATRSNVTFLRDLNALNTLTTAIKDGSWSKLATLKQRPRLTITNKPASYSTGSTIVHKAGDTLEFSFQIGNISDLITTPVRAKLYMNVDSSLPVTEDTVVATKELASLSDTLRYTLPSTFSGPLYWRLEISTLAGLKDFDIGNILYEGIKPVIKVLQVMPSGKTDSSLLNTNNINNPYLSSDDYELQITAQDMGWFNTYITQHASATDKTSGLNGAFDMVVFGFQDMYDRVSTPMLSKAAAEAVKAFAEETKQSLMLTHDTIFREVTAPYQESTNNYNYWSPYFHDMVGQALPRTYLGGNAVNPSTKVISVNQGLLTQYPFNLETTGTTTNRYTVATTHDQFFPLNLERADVIPWYNISGSSRDTDDSYNHFYTYSVGNITFSGTGHTNTKFPEWEQKLFVNTMYRAFTGANHAPDITVYTPQDMSTKPTYQDKLTVSYAATDLDFKDKELITAITLKKLNDKTTGTYVQVDAMPEKTVRSGETVTQLFNNPLHEDGTLQIEITAKDKQGALATKLITLNVKKVDSNLSISRALSSETVERGQPLTITYTVKPNSIPASTVDAGNQGIKQLIISDIQYSEVFPAKLEFNDLAAHGFTQSGNAVSGYTLTKSLGNLTYHLSADGLTYVPDSVEGISFTIAAVPTEKLNYVLDNSNLSFGDLHSLQTATATATTSATDNAIATATTTPAPPVNQTPAPTQGVRVPPLGIARDFNVFILGDINRSGGIEGTMAAGGNVITSGSGIASTFTGDPKTLDALIVGGNLNFSNDSVNGNVVVGGTPTIASNVKIKGELKQGNPIDFAAEFNYLREQSDALAALPDNGRSQRYSWGETLLKGTKATNVFTINGETITNTVGIDVPKGSTVILNITGANATLQNTSFNFCSSTKTIEDYQYSMDSCKGADKYTNTELELQRPKVIYNFYNKTNGTMDAATRLTISSIDIQGTVLAPRASIEFNNGRIYGTLIGASLNGGGTPMNVKFTGETGLPAPTTPVATPAPTITPFPTVTPTPIATVAPTQAPVLARTTLSFAELSFTAYVKMIGLTLEGATIRINTSLNMDLLKKIIPDDASTPTLTWESLNPEVATISDTGVVRGAAAGIASIKLTAVDAAGRIFTANADVTVVAPELSISGPPSAYVGDMTDYVARYVTVDDTVDEYEWSIKEGSNTAEAVLTVDPAYPQSDHALLIAKNPGKVTLSAIAKTKAFKDGTSPVELTVTFTNRPNPVQKIAISGPNVVNIGQQITLEIIATPLNADPAEYNWTLEDDGNYFATIIHEPDTKFIRLEGVKITDLDKPVVVKASLKGAPDAVYDTFNVNVGSQLIGLKLIDSIDIGVGKENSRDLFNINYLTLFPEDIDLKDVEDKLEWSSSNLAVVTVSSDGKITGLIKGAAKVTVMYKDDPSIKSSIKVNVLNEDRY